MLIDKPVTSVAGVIQPPSKQFPQVNIIARRSQMSNVDTTKIHKWLNDVYSKSPMWTSSKINISFSIKRVSKRLLLYVKTIVLQCEGGFRYNASVRKLNALRQ